MTLKKDNDRFFKKLPRQTPFQGDYDFDAEAELVSRCLCGEIICTACERKRPAEIDFNGSEV